MNFAGTLEGSCNTVLSSRNSTDTASNYVLQRSVRKLLFVWNFIAYASHCYLPVPCQ